MRGLLLGFIASFLMLGNLGCLKDTTCSAKSVSSEVPAIEDYILSHGINATADPSGLYYEIINPGSGISPTATSSVSATYTGQLLNGTVFDSSATPIQFYLNGVIYGWQIGLQLLKKGGTIKLIVPSSLAYGCQGRGSIPPNAVLYFEVTLVDVF